MKKLINNTLRMLQAGEAQEPKKLVLPTDINDTPDGNFMKYF